MSQVRPTGYSPTIKKRALSRKLVEARKHLGLTTTQVCKDLKWSATKLNYIEKAKWIEPNSEAVVDLCDLYGIDGSEREALLQLAGGARERGWWTRYNDVFRNEYPGFETAASAVKTYQNVFLPGLLQVEEYIAEVTRAAGIDDPAEIKRHVAARLERQKILFREQEPTRLHAIIDENALLRVKDPAIRGPQLRHLAAMAEHPGIDIQILPIDAGMYPAAGEAFTYLSFADPGERDIVFLETLVDDRLLEEKDELHRYMVRFSRLCDVSLDRAASRTYLKERIE